MAAANEAPATSPPGGAEATPIAERFDERFLGDLHARFVLSLDEKTDTFEFHVTEHLRMSGVYWGATAMDLLGRLGDMDGDKIVAWVLSCRHAGGGFGGSPGHDPHLLYTLSAVQILALFDRLGEVDAARVAAYVASLQRDDGSFAGDEWGERDTRFSYCALSCLALLGRLADVDVAAATAFVARCRNFDGGFGTVPGTESHAGQIFCCVGALAIGRATGEVDADLLGWWLAERQLPCGGLNGRPEKKEDVCYSWWVLSSLSALGRISWIDRKRLGEFILECQDADDGGISDRPGNIADVFHTFFGVAGLSLLGYPGFKEIDPVFALPVHVVRRLGIPALYSTE